MKKLISALAPFSLTSFPIAAPIVSEHNSIRMRGLTQKDGAHTARVTNTSPNHSVSLSISVSDISGSYDKQW